MKLQENKRYTLNEVMQYLTESVESKAVAYCKKNRIDIEKVKETFPKWRIRNCKYFLTLCRIYETISIDKKYGSDVYDDINDINKFLTILGFSDDIDSKFTRTLDDTTDEKYANSPEEIHKRILDIKKIGKAHKYNFIKIDDYHYALEFIADGKKRYFIYDVLRDSEPEYFSKDIKYYKPRNFNNISKIRSYVYRYNEIYKNSLNMELDNMPKENTGKYEIIQINNYNESNSYSKYTDWCVTTSRNMYRTYTKEKYGNAMFYFCLRDDYKTVNPNEDYNKREALDDYGTSMFAVLVTEDNDIVQVTSRWNHSYGGGDNITDVIGLSRYLGFDARAVIQYNKSDDETEDKDMVLLPDYEIEVYMGNWDKFDCEMEDFITIIDNNCYYLVTMNDSGKSNIRVKSSTPPDDDDDDDDGCDYLLFDGDDIPNWILNDLLGYDGETIELIYKKEDGNNYFKFYNMAGEYDEENEYINSLNIGVWELGGDDDIEGTNEYKICTFCPHAKWIVKANNVEFNSNFNFNRPLYKWVCDKSYNGLVCVGINEGFFIVDFENNIISDRIYDEFLGVYENGIKVKGKTGEFYYRGKNNVVPANQLEMEFNESLNRIKKLNKRIKLL